METRLSVLFAPFRLELSSEQLWREEQAIALRPKTFAVLRYLVEHPGQLVTKDELLDAVWAGTVVSDTVLKSCIRELREALGDDVQTPRYIATVHRRGYRFIAKIVDSLYAAGSRPENRAVKGPYPQSSALSPQTSVLVGRDREFAQLQGWLEKALRGERQLVFVTGEAGIGKTTLVNDFLLQLDGQVLWIGRGQCIEQYGAGEAYMPILEALGRLCREPGGERLIALLHQHAPTWLVQMPALLDAAELETLQRKVAGTTRERMLREMSEAVGAITAEQPLILWLEDLHWSDVSTLELLALLARRRERARLLVIGAYRPVDVIVKDHPLREMKRELQLHGQCEELVVRLLSEEHIEDYLAVRIDTNVEAQHAAPLQDLAHAIHQRTEGNPLFMVNVVNALIARSVETRHVASLPQREEVDLVVPENLRQMIEQQVERLSVEEQRVLEIASVAGMEFSAAAVAAGAEVTADEIEQRCTALTRRGQFLQAKGMAEWPDGTMATRYGFLHALYQEVTCERVPAGRRIQLHQRIGERVEAAYSSHATEVAATLAAHFEHGQDYQRAVKYHGQAAQNAMWTYGYHEAIYHLTKGLALLSRLPACAERTQQELSLQVSLSLALMNTQGFVAPAVEQAYARTRVLCQQVGDSLPRFAALWGLRSFYSLRGALRDAHAVAQEFLESVQRTQMSFLAAQASIGMGIISFHLGDCVAARAHLDQGLALYTPQVMHRHVFVMGQDQRATGLAHLAVLLWILGYPDQARECSRQAVTLAYDSLFPYDQALTLGLASVLQLCCRDSQAVEQLAEASQSFAQKCGFRHLVVLGMVLQGWALVMRGKGTEGIGLVQTGLEKQHGMGIGIGEALYQALLAEGLASMNQGQARLQALAQAFTIVEKTEERTYEADLYRLKGELTLQQVSMKKVRLRVKKTNGKGQKHVSVTSPQAEVEQEAEACFLKAIDIAQNQQAKSWELRASTSLARLWQSQGKKKKAHKLLAEIYGWFTEGFETKDLKEAKALLADLS